MFCGGSYSYEYDISRESLEILQVPILLRFNFHNFQYVHFRQNIASSEEASSMGFITMGFTTTIVHGEPKKLPPPFQASWPSKIQVKDYRNLPLDVFSRVKKKGRFFRMVAFTTGSVTRGDSRKRGKVCTSNFSPKRQKTKTNNLSSDQ